MKTYCRCEYLPYFFSKCTCQKHCCLFTTPASRNHCNAILHNQLSVGILSSQNLHRKKDILKGTPLIYIYLNASWEGALFLTKEPVPSSVFSRISWFKSIAICLSGYWLLSSAAFLLSCLVWIFNNSRTILVLTLLHLCPNHQKPGSLALMHLRTCFFYHIPVTFLHLLVFLSSSSMRGTLPFMWPNLSLHGLSVGRYISLFFVMF